MAIEVFFERRIHNSAVRRDVDAGQRREYMLLTILSALFVLGLMFYGWQQYRWIQLGYDIESLEKTKADLMEYHNELLVDFSTAARDSRIEQYARAKLGMVFPTAAQIVTLEPSLIQPSPEIERSEAPLTAAKR